jgi:hypothetical protein
LDIFDKAKDALNSADIEDKSDELLDKAAEFAKEKLGADKADHIKNVRDAIDKKIGDQ